MRQWALESTWGDIVTIAPGADGRTFFIVTHNAGTSCDYLLKLHLDHDGAGFEALLELDRS